MSEKTKSSLTCVLVLTLSAYCYLLKSESKAYERAFDEADAGYASFLQRSVNGKHLYTMIKKDSVAVFKIKTDSIACAILAADLPARPK